MDPASLLQNCLNFKTSSCRGGMFWVSSLLHSSLSLTLYAFLSPLNLCLVCHNNNNSKKNKAWLCAGVRLATACETVCLWHRANERRLGRMCEQTGWLPVSHSQIHTHRERERERETHTQHFLLLTRNTVEAVFHLNEFLNLFVPSPLAAASWWKSETEGAGCQINWCVRRERGQNGVIKRKALPPSHTLSHTQAAGKDRGAIWLPNLTSTEVISGAFPILYSTVQSCSASPRGFVLKTVWEHNFSPSPI